MAELNDNNVEEIAKRAQDGDNEAFEHLFKRFGRALYGTIARIVGDKDSAEDTGSCHRSIIARVFTPGHTGSL